MGRRKARGTDAGGKEAVYRRKNLVFLPDLRGIYLQAGIKSGDSTPFTSARNGGLRAFTRAFARLCEIALQNREETDLTLLVTVSPLPEMEVFQDEI